MMYGYFFGIESFKSSHMSREIVRVVVTHFFSGGNFLVYDFNSGVKK